MKISNSIFRFSVFIYLFIWLVILAGGVVRTTQSGMGCPDWPTCFGKWIPPTSVNDLPADYEKYLRKQDIDHTFNAYHTWIEAINRYLGVLLGIWAIIQFIVFFRKRKSNRKEFQLAALFLGLVIATGLFGAIVVKLNLNHLSITVHLAFAILLLLVQFLLLQVLQNKPKEIVSAKSKNILWFTLGMIVVQFSLGTMVRMHIDDVSKQLNYLNREIWLQDLNIVFIVHRSFSWLILLTMCYVIYHFRTSSLLKKSTKFLLVIGVLNMIVGIIMYYFNIPSWAQPLHLVLGCLAINQAYYLLLKTKKYK